jgi:hypothetical protein
VDKLKVFCASREGCPGVALEEALIRPGCVEKLTLCYLRKDQAVVKQDLRQKVIKKLFESDVNLKVWQDGSYEMNSITETSQICKHLFPAVPNDKDLPEELVEAMEMLSLRDVKEAIFRYRTTISEQRYAIFRAVDDVQRVTGTELPPQAASQINEQESTTSTTVGPEGPLEGLERWKWYQDVRFS